MKIKKSLISVLIMTGLVISTFSIAQSKVSINVTEDQYVLPVAELASTKTNPEIIHMRNDLISLDIIPNRGRILSNFSLTDKQQPFLYQKFVPDPMVLPGGLHTVEFGGYYFSLPWNTRDRQPFDLQFEITSSSEDFGEVFLSGKDMFQKTLTEVWVRMKKVSPVIEIEAKISNTSKKNPKDLEFRDFTVFYIHDNENSNEQIILPVNKIKLLESKNDWAGSKESIFEWPESFSQWKLINDYLVFQSASQLSTNLAGIYNPETKDVFIKSWKPEEFFNGAEIWSWGKNYSNEPGAAPYIVYSNASQFTLQPLESKSFMIYFTVLSDISEQDITPEALINKVSQLLP
ncbi:hypothetical protein [Atribacter laminatus]|uniref:DUF5107 domain-containing protein n=1 Tax=Atribacter laminatus TaxID=2847778 RepID=A0A7T1F3P9_ATRLM|nr:hypothetical protein [Atribacter laminatus]QPM68880.1 hypothetical protein RT761_02107 [Atribacter laminatus]